MDRLLRLTLLLGLTLLAAQGRAETCSNDPFLTGRWVSSVSTQACASNGVTAAQLCQAGAYLDASYPDFSFDTWTSDPYSGAIGNPCYSGMAGSCRRQYTAKRENENGTTSYLTARTATAYWLSDNEVCDPAPVCTAHPAGTLLRISGYRSEFSSTHCVNGCSVTIPQSVFVAFPDSTDVTTYSMTYRSTGQACTQGSGDPTVVVRDTATPTAGQSCVVSINQRLLCISGGDYSISVDGVDFGPYDEEGCTNVEGQVVCGGSAATPPRPDNGTPGEAAAPDISEPVDVVSGGSLSGSTLDLYERATAGGSTVLPPNSGATGGGGTDDGTGSGPGDGYAKGEWSGGQTCDAPPVCTHDDPVQCGILVQQWRTRCGGLGTENELAADDEEPLTDVFPVEEVQLPAAQDDGILGEGTCPEPLVMTIAGKSTPIDLYQGVCAAAEWLAPVIMMIAYLSGTLLVIRSF